MNPVQSRLLDGAFSKLKHSKIDDITRVLPHKKRDNIDIRYRLSEQ
jgi:hypothetical protein